MNHIKIFYIFPVRQVLVCQKFVAYESPQKLLHFSTKLSFGVSHMDHIKNYNVFHLVKIWSVRNWLHMYHFKDYNIFSLSQDFECQECVT